MYHYNIIISSSRRRRSSEQLELGDEERESFIIQNQRGGDRSVAQADNNPQSSVSGMSGDEAGAPLANSDDLPLPQNVAPVSNSISCLPRCISNWLNRYHREIKWIKLWIVFLWRIGIYAIDFGFDMALIVGYGQNGDRWYFSLTLAFVFIPAVFLSYLNWKYYAEKLDAKGTIMNKQNKDCKNADTRKQFASKERRETIRTRKRF